MSQGVVERLGELEAALCDVRRALAAMGDPLAIPDNASPDTLLSLDATCRRLIASVANFQTSFRDLRTGVLLAEDSEIHLRYLDLVEAAEFTGRELEIITKTWAACIAAAKERVKQRTAH